MPVVLAVGASTIACGPTRDDSALDQLVLGRSARVGAELSPDQVAERHAQAVERIAAEDYQAAIDLLQPVVSRRDATPAMLGHYGEALLRNGHPSLAVWPLQRAAVHAIPESRVARLHARALLTGGDAPAAIRELDRLIALVPESPELLRLRAKAHQRVIATEQALADLDRLIDLVPNDLGAREVRIQLLDELDLIQEAREEIAALRERLDALEAPLAARARICASEALFEHQAGESERARAMMLACRESFPIEPDVLLPLVILLDDLGEREAATAALEEAVAGKGSAKLRLWLALADRYASLGRREDVAKVLDEAATALGVPQPLFALADHRVAWGDLEGAKQAVDRALTMQLGRGPGSPGFSWSVLPQRGRFAFGDVLIRAGETERVEEILASFESDEDAEPVYPILLRARLALERGTPREALERFEESFRYWPSNVGARYLAGRAAMELGEFDRGMAFFQDAFRADPAASDAGVVLARMQAAQGLVGAAADTLSTLLGQTTQDPVAMRLFASLAHRIGAHETADQTRVDLAERHGWDDRARADRMLDLRSREGRQAAIDHFETDPAFGDPEQPESWWAWFRLKSEGGGREEQRAVERIQALREASPDSAGIELVGCRVARAIGRPLEESISACRTAFDRDPKLLEAGTLLGRLLLEAGDAEAAAAAFERVLVADPAHLEAAVGRADALLALGREAEAEALYEQALVTHPWYGRAAGVLARRAFERGDVGERTLIHARWAARFHEGDPFAAATLLGEVRLARGEPAEAVTALQVALGHSPSPNPWPLYLLGRAFAALGEEGRAVQAIEDALSIGEFAKADEARALLRRLREGGEG